MRLYILEKSLNDIRGVELHGIKGRLLTRRGDFTAAQRENSLAVQLSPPNWRAFQLQGVAELALWQGHHGEAQAAVAEGLRWWSDCDPEAVLPQLFAPWAVLALRLEADRAERAAARRAPEEVAKARGKTISDVLPIPKQQPEEEAPAEEAAPAEEPVAVATAEETTDGE
jgi:hypothetical protein